MIYMPLESFNIRQLKHTKSLLRGEAWAADCGGAACKLGPLALGIHDVGQIEVLWQWPPMRDFLLWAACRTQSLL